MANVIPREGLSKMQKRNTARFLLIGALMIGGAAVIAILAILPAYVSVRVARAALDSTNQGVGTESLGEDQAAAVRTQGLITNLSPIANATTSPVDALMTALAQKPAGISITTFTYTSGTKTLLLTGTSQQREAVNAFRDALEASGRFGSVAVPVAALVGAQEGRFTVTLGGI
jgi:energy-coupling factor transporter transmembrane protein EcfT